MTPFLSIINNENHMHGIGDAAANACMELQKKSGLKMMFLLYRKTR